MIAEEIAEQAFDALCTEQEKQAALIGMLKLALKDGLNGLSADSLYVYIATMVDQQAKAEAAALALYETAIGRK